MSDSTVYRLQQYLKWKGGWEAIYYVLTVVERESLFDRLVDHIVQFEMEEEKSEVTDDVKVSKMAKKKLKKKK